MQEEVELNYQVVIRAWFGGKFKVRNIRSWNKKKKRKKWNEVHHTSAANFRAGTHWWANNEVTVTAISAHFAVRIQLCDVTVVNVFGRHFQEPWIYIIATPLKNIPTASVLVNDLLKAQLVGAMIRAERQNKAVFLLERLFVSRNNL